MQVCARLPPPVGVMGVGLMTAVAYDWAWLMTGPGLDIGTAYFPPTFE
jgi:hypothetical protein